MHAGTNLKPLTAEDKEMVKAAMNVHALPHVVEEYKWTQSHKDEGGAQHVHCHAVSMQPHFQTLKESFANEADRLTLETE